MPTHYEHGFMFHPIDIGHIEDMSSEAGTSLFGQELAELTQGLNNSLPQFDVGEWEILSHHINFTGLVAMSRLLNRLKEEAEPSLPQS